MERVFALFDWSCKGSVSCPNRRVAWLVTTNLPDPESCYEHLSEEQRAAFNAGHGPFLSRASTQMRPRPGTHYTSGSTSMGARSAAAWVLSSRITTMKLA
jgi:hypothetical protein